MVSGYGSHAALGLHGSQLRPASDSLGSWLPCSRALSLPLEEAEVSATL